jgi:hypothetical protein
VKDISCLVIGKLARRVAWNFNLVTTSDEPTSFPSNLSVSVSLAPLPNAFYVTPLSIADDDMHTHHDYDLAYVRSKSTITHERCTVSAIRVNNPGICCIQAIKGLR